MKLTPISFSKIKLNQRQGTRPAFFVSFGKFVHTLINDEQYDEEKSFCAADADLFFEIAKQNVKKITL